MTESKSIPHQHSKLQVNLAKITGKQPPHFTKALKGKPHAHGYILSMCIMDNWSAHENVASDILNAWFPCHSTTAELATVLGSLNVSRLQTFTSTVDPWFLTEMPHMQKMSAMSQQKFDPVLVKSSNDTNAGSCVWQKSEVPQYDAGIMS